MKHFEALSIGRWLSLAVIFVALQGFLCPIVYVTALLINCMHFYSPLCMGLHFCCPAGILCPTVYRCVLLYEITFLLHCRDFMPHHVMYVIVSLSAIALLTHCRHFYSPPCIGLHFWCTAGIFYASPWVWLYHCLQGLHFCCIAGIF